MDQEVKVPSTEPTLNDIPVDEMKNVPRSDEFSSIDNPSPIQSPPSPESSGFPDGGTRAWLQVLGGWVVLGANWGVVNTFGVYQAYYQTVMLSDYTASSISWIGSLQACLLFLAGLAAGPLFDAGYFTPTLIVGLFMIVFGMFMTSISRTYWQVLLAQGICTGIGMGLTFLPAAAIQAQYFQKRRALAIGIAGTGSPVAGIIFPIIFSKLLPHVGFGWATRVIAFILLGFSVIPIAFMRPRLPPPVKVRSIIDPSAWHDWPYIIYTVAVSLVFLVLYTAFFYVQVFDELNHLSSNDFAPYTVTLLNGGSIFGRLLPMHLSDKWGVLNVSMACTFFSALLVFGWMGVHNLSGIIAFTLLYGMTSGAVVVGGPVVLMGLSPNMASIGTRMGMTFTVLSIAILVGTPITGAILGNFSRARWLGAMGFSAGGLVLGGLCMVLTWLALYKKRGTWKL